MFVTNKLLKSKIWNRFNKIQWTICQKFWYQTLRCILPVRCTVGEKNMKFEFARAPRFPRNSAWNGVRISDKGSLFPFFTLYSKRQGQSKKWKKKEEKMRFFSQNGRFIILRFGWGWLRTHLNCVIHIRVVLFLITSQQEVKTIKNKIIHQTKHFYRGCL